MPSRLAGIALCPRKGKHTPTSKLRDALANAPRSSAGGSGPTADGTHYGTWLFLTFFHKFMTIFTVGLAPLVGGMHLTAILYHAL